MADAVVVNRRKTALHMESLGMSCDAFEIPSLLGAPWSEVRWLVGLCTFAGAVRDAESPWVVVKGWQAALAVTDRRFLGIASPTAVSEPAIWWSWSLDELGVEVQGTRGVISKRPDGLLVNHRGGPDQDGDCVHLKVVSQMAYRTATPSPIRHNTSSPRREASLHAALTGRR